MKTKHLLVPLAMCCAFTVLVGCASTNHQMSESSLDKNLERDEAPFSTGLSQPVILDERAFRGLDLATNEAVTLEEWQHLDTSVEAKEKLSKLDANDGQINATEFLTEAPKHTKLYSVFEGAEKTNNNLSSWDRQEFQPQGSELFAIRF